MKKRILLIPLALLLAISFIAFGCPAQPEEPIVIGVVMELTGPFAPSGIYIDRGIKYCLDKAGWAVAGREVKLVVEDSATDVTIALDKAKKLVETDKADILIAPIHSGECLAIAGYLERARVPALAVAPSADEMPLEYNWFWSTDGTLRQHCYPLGPYMYDEMGFRTVTVLGTDFIAGREFIAGALDEFKAKGGQVVQEQWFPLGTKDFGPYLSAFRPADAVLAWVAGGDEIAFYQQYREWKIEMPVMQAVMDTLADPQFMPLMGDTNVGVFGMIMGVWTVDTPENKAWAEAYEQEFGEAPSYWAYDGYITTSVALAALEATGGNTDPDKLAAAITNVSVDTPFGNYSFTEDRVVIKNYYLVRCDMIGGEVVPVVLGTYRMRAVRVGDTMVPELLQ